MTDQGHGHHDFIPGGIAIRRSLPWIVGVTALAAGSLLAWKHLWTNPAPKGTANDPSIVISTFITLYTFFLTGFVALVGLVTSKEQAREVLKAVAIFSLIEATLMDLWRVSDSMDDLYKAATNGLTYQALYDTIHDFYAYFVINVFVVVVAVMAACMPARSRNLC
jgi:hypothetical protein